MTFGVQQALPTLDLDPGDYPGGIGVWGSLPAIYDTTRSPPEHGVHVHARKIVGRKKNIDLSYGRVNIVLKSGVVAIREAEATPYVASAVLRLPITTVTCPYCGLDHLDEARFAIHPHQMHRCHRCGADFLEAERQIGNPIMRAKSEMGDSLLTRPTVPGGGPLRMDQASAHCSGGILIWGSNPAIVWTAKRSEEAGIHVHTFEAGNPSPVVDDTYDSVDIDGVRLHAPMVRAFMVQQSFPHLRSSIASVTCSQCGCAHFDDVPPYAVEPHRNHKCVGCGHVEVTVNPIISNPLAETLAKLYANASRVGLQKNPLAP